MSTDAELLHRYVAKRDERAFAELVQRHLGLVYSAALRRTGGRSHLAEEISQKVFSDLARKAALLAHHPVLTGWLYRSTRYAAIDAVRAEVRRQKLDQSLAAMSDLSSPPESVVDWEQLRPVLDEALDRMSERDREIMLLRFFQGQTYAEVGSRLNLSENAARMRTERALDKLRTHLGKRGVTSTAAALGLLLAHQPLVAAPAGLVVTVTTTALAAAPTGVAASFVSFFLMSKFTAPALVALLAAGLATLAWTATAHTVSAEELAALRRENARLATATAAGADAASVAAVADEFSTHATAIAQAMTRRHAGNAAAIPAGSVSTARSEVSARGHRYRGTSTAHEAAMTFGWACDISDPDELAKLLYFDDQARQVAQEILVTMPESLRAEYPTPEAFYGMLLAASTIEGPPPGADLMERFMKVVEIAPGRAATRRLGSDQNMHEYQLTADGWKYVLPEGGVKGLPNLLNSETLARLSRR